MTSVSFQGERGAYSEAAAKSFFAPRKISTVPHQNFADALCSTADGTTDYAILPVENSIEGSVGESYDLLMCTTLVPSGEIYHRIRHCLIGFGAIDEITEIISHPQALGQCRNFIKKHKKRTIPAYDTAGSVKEIGISGVKTAAGIASMDAAAIYHVPIIAEDIADNQNNYTRFLLLSRDERPGPTGHDKTSIIFSIKHEPGSLYKIMNLFYAQGINMTKIESRPTKDNAWEYNFYVDFEGHADEPRISGMLDAMGADASLRILGSYPSAGAYHT